MWSGGGENLETTPIELIYTKITHLHLKREFY